MNRSLELESFLDDMTEQMFGRKLSTSIAEGKCPVCGREIGHFRDALSEQEFRISGLCQGCQDRVFGE